MVQDARGGKERDSRRAADIRLAKEGTEMAKAERVTCEDCYFRKNMLCALKLTEPCATFRHADRGLRPNRQLAFVFRTDRTRAAYAFPPPGQPD
jgi:hypothetical protein